MSENRPDIARAGEFGPELRRLGFKREWRTRDAIQYTKTIGDRKIEVQLWCDGRHRASHFLGNRMSTAPTCFSNVGELAHVVEHELTRTDHPPPIDPRRPVMVLR